MESQQLNKKIMLERRKLLEDLLKRRFFYNVGFDIYGGVAGLYDFGPAGCAVKINVEQVWREHFVLEEDMLEISCTCLTPSNVLKASGHVDKFSDFIVRDLKTKAGFRADKLLEEFIDKQLEKEKNESKIKELKLIQAKADSYSKEEIHDIFKKLNIKSPETGNDLSEPEDFNLMFATQIGPTGNNPAFLRPETAQGIFVNFAKLYEYNNGKIPFAAAQIGLGFRNEIAPRSALLRVREFQMAEIEHFIDPEDKTHPKFLLHKDLKLPLYSQDCQENLEDPIKNLTVGEAVSKKIIDNETLAYFMCRTFQFLVSIGINQNNIRFRQHLKKEMAHYATDCWDAEIETSYGWIECVGIADRSCYDLNQHSVATKSSLVAARKYKNPVLRTFVTLIPNKKVIGKDYKGDSKLLLSYFESMTEQCKLDLKQDLESKGKQTVTLEGKEFELNPNNVEVQVKQQNVMEEKFCPSVIEPSFGIGRIIYCIFEHCFQMRDERRTYLKLPPRIAPVKCSVLSVIQAPEYREQLTLIKNILTKAGLSSKLDDSGVSIGKRYARTDEIGIPFGITVDKQTLSDQTVTLRELFTTKQIRIQISELVSVLQPISEGTLLWEDVMKKYPLFEINEDN